jgi:hypothetical protein
LYGSFAEISAIFIQVQMFKVPQDIVWRKIN